MAEKSAEQQFFQGPRLSSRELELFRQWRPCDRIHEHLHGVDEPRSMTETELIF